MKVYVNWDPLFERVVCVHSAPGKVCTKCLVLATNAKGYDSTGMHRMSYEVEEAEFEVQTEKDLIER